MDARRFGPHGSTVRRIQAETEGELLLKAARHARDDHGKVRSGHLQAEPVGWRITLAHDGDDRAKDRAE